MDAMHSRQSRNIITINEVVERVSSTIGCAVVNRNVVAILIKGKSCSRKGSNGRKRYRRTECAQGRIKTSKKEEASTWKKSEKEPRCREGSRKAHNVVSNVKRDIEPYMPGNGVKGN
jgi:hypothetical protein